jgi:hypothetical protein
MIDNLAQPIACSLVVMIGVSFRMKVRRGQVYPHQTLLDDIQIDASSHVVVKVDKVDYVLVYPQNPEVGCATRQYNTNSVGCNYQKGLVEKDFY